MNRERALKVVLGLVGLIFVASVYPLVTFVRQAPDMSMMFSLYVTPGIFLLRAVPNPSESRTLIAFTAWSSFAHAAVMGLQAFLNIVARVELLGAGLLVVIGVFLIALAPARQIAAQTSAAAPTGSLPVPSNPTIPRA
jgi:hypothetical protein